MTETIQPRHIPVFERHESAESRLFEKRCGVCGHLEDCFVGDKRHPFVECISERTTRSGAAQGAQALRERHPESVELQERAEALAESACNAQPHTPADALPWELFELSRPRCTDGKPEPLGSVRVAEVLVSALSPEHETPYAMAGWVCQIRKPSKRTRWSLVRRDGNLLHPSRAAAFAAGEAALTPEVEPDGSDHTDDAILRMAVAHNHPHAPLMLHARQRRQEAPRQARRTPRAARRRC